MHARTPSDPVGGRFSGFSDVKSHQIGQGPAVDGCSKGLHPIVADLVEIEVEFSQGRQRPAADGCSESLHPLIPDLVVVEVEFNQGRQRPAAKT